MAKEVLASDIDEVLYPFLRNFLADYNPTYGTDHTLDAFDTYDFDGPLGLSVAETVERVYDFIGRDEMLHTEPIEEAREAIARLQRSYEFDLITARDSQFESITRRWVEINFPGIFRSVNFVGYAAIMETPRTKVSVCREIGAIALIDDSLKHVAECAKEDVQGVLFGNYGWNQAVHLPTGVVRCGNWQQVAEHFNA